ncbi:MAG: xanthine dehydrogenase family protein molybdopterin-binding subunit [Acidimicrobiia bacterium]|nr:xanthine dehydrogenase family protein molybdopterin-binding subunit [Acidimicrobiia bacterium]
MTSTGHEDNIEAETWPRWIPFPDTARVEDRRFVLGQGRYVANLSPPEGTALHAGFVRSDVACGLVRGIDVEAARNHPGVAAVFTGVDLALDDIGSGIDGLAMPRPILATDRVQHVGEALAMVVAVDGATVADALELVSVDIDVTPAVVDPLQALEAAPLHPSTNSNLVATSRIGEPDHGWDHPDVAEIVEVTVRNQRLAPVTLEPLSTLAVPHRASEGGVRLHVGHQAPHLLKKQLSRWFGQSIEISVPDVGGGYGLKARLYPEYVAVVEACRRLDRPVRWLQGRSEQFLTGSHGRDMVHRVRIGGSRSGRIRRVDIDFVLAVGAYPHLGAMVASFTRLVSQQLYDIAELSVTSSTVATNTAPIAPYRGAGRPEAAYAMERALDAFARRIGADPLDVRARNLLAPTAWPHRTATGADYDSGDYGAALDRAVELLDVPSVRAEQQRRLSRRASDPASRLLGVGLAAWVERAGGAPDTGEYARVEAGSDGGLVVLTGSTDNGQGHETVWAQVAGAAFGMDAAMVAQKVTVVAGDTTLVPRGTGSSASRSAQIGASAVFRCSHRLRRLLADVAADLLEAAPADVVSHDGGFQVQGVPHRGVDLALVVAEATRRQSPVAVEEWHVPGAQTFPYGVHAAVVEVDAETGFVAVVRYVAVDDCGVVLHPAMVEGQTIGSVAQGIGQALFEQVVYGPDGQLLTGTLLDYTVPGSTDLPPDFVSDRIESAAPSNPLGAKGAGEGGCIGAPPAVVNAVLDALAPLGVEHLDMPLYPERVWSAIAAAGNR